MNAWDWLDVRRRERARFTFFACLIVLLSFAQTLGLVASESVFLARFGAGALPLAFVVSALAAVASMALYAALVACWA